MLWFIIFSNALAWLSFIRAPARRHLVEELWTAEISAIRLLDFLSASPSVVVFLCLPQVSSLVFWVFEKNKTNKTVYFLLTA
jgi:hypothetical protein